MYVIISFNEGEIKIRKITIDLNEAMNILNTLNKNEKTFDHDIQVYTENYDSSSYIDPRYLDDNKNLGEEL